MNYGRKQEALSGSAGNCNVSLSLSLAMSFPGLRQEFIQNTELLEFGIGSFSLGMGFFLRKDLRGSTSQFFGCAARGEFLIVCDIYWKRVTVFFAFLLGVRVVPTYA